MRIRESLRTNLGAESKAYGYTLSIWGSGALLILRGSIDSYMVLSFIFGAVLAFAFLAFAAFRGVFKTVDFNHHEQYIVASIIHILSSFGNVLLSFFLIELFVGEIPMWLLFGLIGFHASFSYNILLLIEYYLSEKLLHWEMKVLRFFR